jgi:hypothetical protein
MDMWDHMTDTRFITPTQAGNWRIRCCGVLLSFFCLYFHRLFLLMTSLLLFVLILHSTYLARRYLLGNTFQTSVR